MFNLPLNGSLKWTFNLTGLLLLASFWIGGHLSRFGVSVDVNVSVFCCFSFIVLLFFSTSTSSFSCFPPLFLIVQFVLLVICLYFVLYLIWILLVIPSLLVVVNVLSCWMVSVGVVGTWSSCWSSIDDSLGCVLLYLSEVAFSVLHHHHCFLVLHHLVLQHLLDC